MSETMSLPIQTQRGTNMRIIVPCVIAAPVLFAPVFFYVLQTTPNMPHLAVFLLPCLSIISNLIVAVILIKALNPAQITINRTSITETFIPILGFNNKPPANRSLSEFDRIEVVRTQGSKGGGNVWIVLRSKEGKTDLRFSAPPKTDASDYAQQLGALINLKVSNNA